MKTILLSLLLAMAATAGHAQTQTTTTPRSTTVEWFIIDGQWQKGSCYLIAPGWGAKIATALWADNPAWVRSERLGAVTRAELGLGSESDEKALLAYRKQQADEAALRAAMERARQKAAAERAAEMRQEAQQAAIIAAIERQTQAVEENTRATEQAVQDQLLIQRIIEIERAGGQWWVNRETAERLWGTLDRE